MNESLFKGIYSIQKNHLFKVKHCIFFKNSNACFVLTILVINLFPASAQPVDSTEKKLQTLTTDSLKAAFMLDAAIGYYKINQLQYAEYYIKKAISVSDKDEPLKAKIFKEWGDVLHKGAEYSESIEYKMRALAIFKKTKDYRNTGWTLNDLGRSYHRMKEDSLARKYLNESLIYFRTNKDEKGIASYYNNYGIIFESENIFDSALYYYDKSLQIKIKLNDKSGEANTLNNIGEIYSQERKKDSAEIYLFRCLAIREALGDPEDLARSYRTIGKHYMRFSSYEKALSYLDKAEAIGLNSGYVIILSTVYENKSKCYSKIQNYKKAYEYHVKYIGQRDSIFNLENESAILKADFLAQAEENKRRQELKIQEHKIIQEAELEKEKFFSRSAYLVLALVLVFSLMIVIENRKKKKANLNFQKINKKLKITNEIDRAILSKTSLKEIADASLGHISRLLPEIKRASFFVFDTEKGKVKILSVKAHTYTRYDGGQEIDVSNLSSYTRLKAGEIVNVSDIKKLQAISESDRVLLESGMNSYLLLPMMYNGELIGSLNLCSDSISAFNEDNEKSLVEITNGLTLAVHQFKLIDIINDSKLKLEVQNKDIVDSIKYAKRIQYTLLAGDDMLQSNLGEYFVHFLPKDIVSGDFYWCTKKGDDFYLAVCDCTGHGVPGAFMSLLSISFLNEAINEKNISEPHLVMNFIRERIIKNTEGSKDGMDAILMRFTKNKIQYAAAQNSPVWIHQGKPVELNSDKMPVGYGIKNDTFNLHEFSPEKGDMIYLHTDGYADQFGGPKGKKLKFSNLLKMLEKCSEFNCIDQSDFLKTKFSEWKGDMEQVDDVCIVGIRI